MGGKLELETLQIQAATSGLNCIAWSEDGDLALASGEYFHVFTRKNPRSRKGGIDPSTGYRQWHSSRIRANTFTSEEWPILKGKPFSTFSIGEEQSISTVSAIAWSPPGIAQHRRSLLAVLTSNLVLSLWETNGEVGRWKRVCLIHKALESHFGTPGDELDPLRKRFRVRSFCWSPPCLEDGGIVQRPKDWRATSGSKWGASYLAIANDNHEIIILRPHREENSLDHDTKWNCQVITTVKLQNSSTMLPAGIVGPFSLFSDFATAPGITHDICWSPWVQKQAIESSQFQQSFISVICGTQLEVINVESPRRTPGSQETLELIAQTQEGNPILEECFGPMSWQPLAISDNMSLAIMQSDTPVICEFSTTGRLKTTTVLDHFKKNIPVRPIRDYYANRFLSTWTVKTRSENPDSMIPSIYSQAKLHCVGTTHDNLVMDVELQSGAISPPVSAPWSDLLDDAVRSFAVKHDLGDAATAYIRGLTSNGSHVAICFSLRPTDVIEYVTPAFDFCHILFHKAFVEDDTATLDYAQSIIETRKNIFQWMMEYLSQQRSAEVNSVDKVLLLTQVRVLAAASSDIGFLTPYLSLMDNLNLPVSRYIQSSGLGNVEMEDADTRSSIEVCEICRGQLDAVSMEEAMCENGHAFSRCCLSLLAIQEPDISKRCNICERQYLDLSKVQQREALSNNLNLSVPEGEEFTQQDGSSSTSILKQLFEVFDTCAFCEGKFSG